MYSNGKWISLLALAALVVTSAAPIASAQSYFLLPAADAARDLFNVAQKSYDEGKLDDAERKLREVIRRYPKNPIADKADYYLILTLSQRGNTTEALNRINSFARLYPRSQWQTDVEEMRIRMTNRVSPFAMRVLTPPPPPPPPPAPAPAPPSPPSPPTRRGQAEATDPTVSLQQEIMQAVFRNNPERAIEIANERLKTNPADPLVMSSLHMVAGSRSPQALPMLLAIAKNSTSTRARKDAIFWMSQTRADRDTVVDALVALLPSLGDEEAESVTHALSQIRTDKSIGALATIARDKSKNEKVRNNALFWIGQSRVPNRISLLQDVYKSNMDSAKTRLQVVFAFSQIREAQVIPILGNIASTDPDIEVRKQAVFWLGQNRGPEAGKELENLLQRK